jgi:hypothetical protein
MKHSIPASEHSTVRVFRQKFTLEDAIGSRACSLEANMRVTNGIPLGSFTLLPVDTVNRVATLKAPSPLGEQETRLLRSRTCLTNSLPDWWPVFQIPLTFSMHVSRFGQNVGCLRTRFCLTDVAPSLSCGVISVVTEFMVGQHSTPHGCCWFEARRYVRSSITPLG